MFFKIDVLENFAKFTEKHLYWSLFLIKLQASGPVTSSKKETPTECFPVKFAKFLGTPFLTEHFRWLLLLVVYMLP